MKKPKARQCLFDFMFHLAERLPGNERGIRIRRAILAEDIRSLKLFALRVDPPPRGYRLPKRRLSSRRLAMVGKRTRKSK